MSLGGLGGGLTSMHTNLKDPFDGQRAASPCQSSQIGVYIIIGVIGIIGGDRVAARSGEDPLMK